ncbi:MAG: dTDP-4-dehydrorhamnose reductase [Thermodesulfobacteriota bacterium]
MITGATGMIGCRLSSVAVTLGHDVYSAQHQIVPEFGTPVEFNMHDTNSIETCIERVKPDAVIHLAALTTVDLCESERDLAMQMNAKAVEKIAKEASKHSSHLVYVSTEHVFDGNKGRYSETDKTNPLNWYGKTKLLGEEAVQSNASSWCIGRTCAVFGIHHKKKNFPMMLVEKLMAGQEMQVWKDQYISPTYVNNLSGMLAEISERKLQGIFHLSGSSRLSRLEQAKLLTDKLGLDESLLRPVTMKDAKLVAKRPWDSSLDVSKATANLKSKPESIENGSEEFVKELKSRMKLKT